MMQLGCLQMLFYFVNVHIELSLWCFNEVGCLNLISISRDVRRIRDIAEGLNFTPSSSALFLHNFW